MTAKLAYEREFRPLNVYPHSEFGQYLYMYHYNTCKKRYHPEALNLSKEVGSEAPGALELSEQTVGAAARATIAIAELGPAGYRQHWTWKSVHETGDDGWEIVTLTLDSGATGSSEVNSETPCVEERWRLTDVKSVLEGSLTLRRPLPSSAWAIEIRVLEARGVLGRGLAHVVASDLNRSTRVDGRPGIVIWPRDKEAKIRLAFGARGSELPGGGILKLAFRTVGHTLRSTVDQLEWDLEKSLVGALPDPRPTIAAALGLVQRPEQLGRELAALDAERRTRFFRLLQRLGIGGSWNRDHELRAAAAVLGLACGEILGEELLVEPARRALDELRFGRLELHLPLEPALETPVILQPEVSG